MFALQPLPRNTIGGGIIPPPSCGPNAAGVVTVTSGTSHVVNMPASMPAGQTIVIVTVNQGSGFPVLTPPSGYAIRTIGQSLGGNSANGVVRVHWKTSTGSEPSTETITTSLSAGMVTITYCVSCPFNASRLGNQGTSGSTTITMPTPTPSVGTEVLQMVAFGWLTDGFTLSSFCSGYTSGYATGTTGSGSTDVALAVGFKLLPGGTASPGTLTMSGSGVEWAAITEVFD